jgi:hypothetical protein
MDIKKIIENNREVLLFIASVLILLSILGYLFLKDRIDTGTGEAYPVNLDTRQEVMHNWDAVNTIGDIDDIDVKELDVYTVGSMGIEKVRDLVRELDFVMSSEVVSDDGRFYSWTKGGDSAQYDSVAMSFVAVTSGAKLEKLEPRSLNRDSVIEYFDEFVSEYIENGQNSLVTAERSGDTYEVRGTWLVDGYPVVGPYNQEEMIVVRFNDIGTLLSISMSLAEFSVSDDSVSLASIPEVLSYLRAGSYPKEAFLSQKAGSGQGCSTEGCIDFEVSALDGFTEATIDEAQIVYLLNPYDSSDVLPVYQLRGSALVRGEGTSVNADITIYANAIDPSQIMIPSEE